MTLQYINTGSSSNKGDGDTLRNAFRKINDNFRELYATTGLSGINTPIVTVQDQAGLPSVDIKSFSGTSSISTNTPTLLFSFPSIGYSGASIDIVAQDQTDQTKDVGTGYGVIWNGTESTVIGTGIISIGSNGTTNNSSWDIYDSIATTSTVSIRAFNASNTSTAHTIKWRAKVSLFRS